MRIASAFGSGIEWETGMYSTSNGPTVNGCRGRTTVTGIFGAFGSPARLASSSAAANGVMKTGASSCGQKSISAP